MASSKVRFQTSRSLRFISDGGGVALAASANRSTSMSGTSISVATPFQNCALVVHVLQVERLLRLASHQDDKDGRCNDADEGGLPTHNPAFLFGVPGTWRLSPPGRYPPGFSAIGA